MGRFLSREKTKADLAKYLADAVLKKNANSPKLVITSASGHTRSNRTLQFEENNHEEANTLMICLAAAESQRCHGAWMVFFTPDTDVLVLAIAHYDKLCKNKAISIVSGVVEIGPIWGALGEEKAAALHVFHAFTGADTVGRFSGLGKTKWFQQYMKADSEVVAALMKLTQKSDVTQDV